MVMSIGELIKKINVENDRDKLYRWYQNAYSKDVPEIMTAALKRAIELRAKGFVSEDEFEIAVYHALAGYEIALSIKNERRTLASRTRELIGRLKPLKALKFLINSTDEKFGLVTLSKMQLAEFTFESVIVTHYERFEPEEVFEAQFRLNEIFETRPNDFIYPKIESNIF
jgi:hypothetical protein